MQKYEASKKEVQRLNKLKSQHISRVIEKYRKEYIGAIGDEYEKMKDAKNLDNTARLRRFKLINDLSDKQDEFHKIIRDSNSEINKKW